MPDETIIKLALADDHKIFRDGVRMALKQLVLVGVDATGNNITNYTTFGDNGELIKHKGIVADKTRNCPPYCGSGGGSEAGELSWT